MMSPEFGRHQPLKMNEEPMEACIEACLACYRTCLETAMGHCLEAGGRHVEPAHFRLMIACAEACRASAHVMLTRTPHHTSTCAACASLCDACADDCERLGGMEACVAACRRCAETCREMSA